MRKLKAFFIAFLIYVSGMLSGALLSRTVDFKDLLPPAVKEKHFGEIEFDSPAE